MDKVQQALGVTLSGFESSLHRHMPDSPYRSFYLWGLRQENDFSKTWQEVIGIPQFVNLTVYLLADFVKEDDWERLLEFSSVMNSYLIYETLSDNLAIGLEHVPRGRTQESYTLQREVLYNFNNAAIMRLEGSDLSTSQLLQPSFHTMQNISCFAQSLTQEELSALATQFAVQYPHMTLDDVEYGAWPALVANIEACCEVADIMQDSLLSTILRKGLAWRYQAVNRLLLPDELPVNQVVDVSTYAILVIPVLSFYISVLMEALYPNDRLILAVQNAKLAKALYDAALLVRLLNDIGTQLLVNEEARRASLEVLRSKAQKTASASIYDLLLDTSDKFNFLTRIRKDICYGEFNISLRNIQEADGRTEAIELLDTSLTHFAHVYAKVRKRMMISLDEIAQLMQDDTASKLITKFVKFHEYLYDQPFDTQAGDYATKPLA
jgi:hypothetical protein